MDKEFLLLGNIIDSFGLDGMVKVFSTSNNQNIRYKKGNKVFLKSDDQLLEMTVEQYRSKGQFDLIKFEEISTIDEANKFKSYSIIVYKDASDLKEGYFYYSDLEGCVIIDDNGKEYGKVIKVEEYPANINLRIQGANNKTFFIPFIKEFIKEVDIKNKKILINYMEGLI